MIGIIKLFPINHSNKHYFLFDEVDGYKTVQQQRMKSWMNREHIVCVMTTNHIQRIDKGLRSRCFEVEFNASKNVYDYVQRMKQIIQQHKMPMPLGPYRIKIV